MVPEKKKPARVWPVLRNYGRAVSAYPWLLAAAVAGVLIIEATQVAAPLYLRQFIDLLAGGETSPAMVSALLGTLALFAAIHMGGWIGDRIRAFATTRAEARTMTDLYQSAFSYMLGHSHEFFISNFTGTLTRRVSRYARSFESVFDNVIFNFLPAFLFAGGVIGVLWVQNVYLGAGLLVWTILFLYVQYRLVSWIQPLRTARAEEDSHVTGVLSDAVTNHPAIASFASLPQEEGIFRTAIMQWYRVTRRSWDADMWINGVQDFLALVVEVALLAGAVYLWRRGVVTVGDFVLIQVYVLGLLNRVWGIGRSMRQLYDAFAEATEMLDILELPHAIEDKPAATQLKVADSAIDFDHVRFEYRDGHTLLADFNLSIAPHEKVALVGSSGAGKSTITKLLLRLYDIQGGSIRIDGQDISEVTQASLRAAISFVPQEPLLFHRTLMENIRYGRQDASDEEVVEAAKQAHCFEFIAKYEEGFGTLVGERGVKLSGGERQRVAIARAILKNAPILVLDEATSSLDSESERLIQDALRRLMEGKTVIAIAHRLSTVMHMDRLVVMEKGSVELTGSHLELLAHESNLYKKLWEIQAGGFLRAD